MSETLPEKRSLLNTGKAKSLYETSDPNQLIMLFRDDTSAFDGRKTTQLADKGSTNNRINAFVMSHLEEHGIQTHFIRETGDCESLVKRLDMLPVEFVVRNIAAGTLCKRLGIEPGLELPNPLFELFLKDDELHDPMITDDHAVAFGWADPEQLQRGRRLSLEVNTLLKRLFADAGLLLVDYKLEFGLYNGELTLGDEFTPDGCRLWDSNTRESLDKDRFRQDLGDVVESYREVAQRLGME